MKQRKIEVNNGLIFSVQVPESVEEYNQLAKRPDGSNACLDDATDNTIYRGVLPDAWYAMATILKARTGTSFGMKDHPDSKKDAAGNILQVRAESYPKYVDRVAAEQQISEADLQALADEISNSGWDETEKETIKGTDGKAQEVDKVVHHTLTFDPSARERQVKVPTPGKQDLLDALDLMKEPKVLARAIKKIGATLGREVVLPPATGDEVKDREATQVAVALAIRDYGHAIAKASKSGLKG